jgi:hypothetical protein
MVLHGGIDEIRFISSQEKEIMSSMWSDIMFEDVDTMLTVMSRDVQNLWENIITLSAMRDLLVGNNFEAIIELGNTNSVRNLIEDSFGADSLHYRMAEEVIYIYVYLFICFI